MCPIWGSPDSGAVSPEWGSSAEKRVTSPNRGGGDSRPETQGGRVAMKLVKRFAIAAGSLLALVLAGGAHFRV